MSVLKVVFLTSIVPLFGSSTSNLLEESSPIKSIQHRTLSSDLDDLTGSTTSEIIQNLSILTKQYEDFTPEDVARVADLLLECKVSELDDQQQGQSNLQALSDTISNLQEIDSAILEKSNLEYGATNDILTCIFEMIPGFDYNNMPNPNTVSKLFLLETVDRSESWSGALSFIVAKDLQQEGWFRMTYSINNYDIEMLPNFYAEDGLEQAFTISIELNQAVEDSHVIGVIFITPKLFISQKPGNFIGGILKVFLNGLYTYYPESLGSRLATLYKGGQSNQKLHCTFWSDDAGNTGPFWDEDDTLADLSVTGYTVCKSLHLIPANKLPSYALLASTPSVFDTLLDLLYSNKSTGEKMRDLCEVSERFAEFQAADIELVAKILEKVSWDPDIKLNNLSYIINNLLDIDRDIFRASQTDYQSTDTILKQIDRILIKQRYEGHGTHIKTENFGIIIANTTMTGVLLFHDYNVVQIYDNAIEDFPQYKNVVSGVRFNSELKDQFNDSKIIVTIFMKDSLFNENRHRDILNHAYGVILPKFEQDEGPLVSLIQNQSLLLKDQDDQECTFWNYRSSAGFWQLDLNSSMKTVVNDLSICDFWHTTHFACLLLEQSDLSAANKEILDWITTINCGLSIFGIFSIFVTAVSFKQWRGNSGNRILLNFVIALALQIAAFYISDAVNNVLDPNTENSLACTISGLLLHYSVISQFCWMLVIAILQYRRFVQVFGGPPNHLMLKSSLCGWILPILPVISVLAADDESYVHSQVGLCYPSGMGLYLGVWMPVLAILIANVVIFLLIVYHVVFSKSDCANANSDDVYYQWRLAALLFFMLGLNWIFGFLCEIDFDVIFVYLFTFTATLQGFFMFLFFVAFHSTTRSLYFKASIKVCNIGFKKTKYNM